MTRCPYCGCDPHERSQLLKVFSAANTLITEGRMDNNEERIVEATKALIECCEETWKFLPGQQRIVEDADAVQ